jgi:hypothetical protein
LREGAAPFLDHFLILCPKDGKLKDAISSLLLEIDFLCDSGTAILSVAWASD